MDPKYICMYARPRTCEVYIISNMLFAKTSSSYCQFHVVNVWIKII